MMSRGLYCTNLLVNISYTAIAEMTKDDPRIQILLNHAEEFYSSLPMSVSETS
ncbi:hypothetical protein DPMN_132319 [Dreissena polymorpha]|uniref:Uncharacterized protein n=1 Tax=Dreissena polymorpha TaxID=45954 RepID=A0A9D4FT49_DREPO|nr:hypothetical protein DPMN_132319 [Dreissena polymorpha]